MMPSWPAWHRGGHRTPKGFGPARRALALPASSGLSPAFSRLLFGEAPPEDFSPARGDSPESLLPPPRTTPS